MSLSSFDVEINKSLEPTWLQCRFWMVRQWAMKPYRHNPNRCPKWRKKIYHLVGKTYSKRIPRQAFLTKLGRLPTEKQVQTPPLELVVQEAKQLAS